MRCHFLSCNMTMHKKYVAAVQCTKRNEICYDGSGIKNEFSLPLSNCIAPKMVKFTDCNMRQVVLPAHFEIIFALKFNPCRIYLFFR